MDKSGESRLRDYHRKGGGRIHRVSSRPTAPTGKEGKKLGVTTHLFAKKKVKSGRKVVVEEKEDKQDDPLDVWSSYITKFFLSIDLMVDKTGVTQA